MKVFKPGTDCEANFKILVNGRACDEYVLPGVTDEPTASICFVPVSDGSTITIQGTFSGSVLYGRVDVLADGAFVADRIIEDYGSKEGKLKHWDNRKVDVKTFLHVPDLSDHKYRCRPKVVEGNLIVKRLSDKLTEPLHGGDEATGIGLGSITLILSLNQEVFDTYESEPGEPAYPSVSLGSWRGSTGDVADSGIQPEHELRMDVFPDANPVKDKRATLFWRDLKAARFGPEPWASLIFYYRSQAAIDAAGCVPLTEAKALPGDRGLFTRASDQALSKGPEAMSTSNTPASQAESQSTRESASPPSLPPSLPPSVPTQSPEPKKRLGLGQTLLLSSNQHAGDLVPEIMTSAHFKEKRSIFNTAHSPSPESDTIRKVNRYASFENPSPTPPRLTHNGKSHSPRYSKPHVSFSDPLTITAKDCGAVGDSATYSLDEHHISDLALPSLPGLTSQPSTTRSERGTSRPPSILPKHVEALSNKRSASQSDILAPTDTSTPASPPSAKRPRSEDLRERKLQLERALQEKRERKAAMQKKLDDEIRERERQQQLWAEEDARKRENEERRRAAEREEEARRAEDAAIEAEMEALERENEMEDQDLVRVAEQDEDEQKKWDEILKARESETDC